VVERSQGIHLLALEEDLDENESKRFRLDRRRGENASVSGMVRSIETRNEGKTHENSSKLAKETREGESHLSVRGESTSSRDDLGKEGEGEG